MLDREQMNAGMTARSAVSRRSFWRHFAEMVIAMIVGMALGMAALAPLDPMYWGVEQHTLAMASSMAVGMAAWMRWRRHGAAAIAEMVGAMYVPFLALLPPYWLGWLSGSGLLVLGHALMLPAMVLVMLWRPEEYVGHRR